MFFFNFLYNFSEIFLLLRRIHLDIINDVRTFSCKVPVILFIFTRHIFEKSSYLKFHENPSTGSRVFQCGNTDRHGEANSLFFCNFANAPNDSHQYTDRNVHEPTEGFDTKWEGWLIIRCMVTLIDREDGDCMVCRKHFNSFNTQCGQIMNTSRPTHAYKLCKSSLCIL